MKFLEWLFDRTHATRFEMFLVLGLWILAGPPPAGWMGGLSAVLAVTLTSFIGFTFIVAFRANWKRR